MSRVRCAWCDRLRKTRFIGRPFSDLTVPVCQLKCAAQWNRWCRNKRMDPAIFCDLRGRVVDVPVYKLRYFVRKP